MIIRPASPNDLNRIYQITEQSFGPYCAAQAIYERYGIGRGVEDKARSVRRFCERHIDQVVVAEEGARVVGYYSYCPHDEYGMLQLAANAVDPAFQGRGIGTKMARHVVRDLIENQEQENLFVATLVHDKPARKVYEKVGFSEVYQEVSFSNWKRCLKLTQHPIRPGMEIRPVAPSDRDRLLEIALSSPAARFYPERLMEERFGALAGSSWQQRSTRELSNRMESEQLFVADIGGEIGGYTSFACPTESEFGRVSYPRLNPELEFPELRDLLFDFALSKVQAVESTRIVDVGVSAADDEALGSCKAVGLQEFSCGISFALKRAEAVFS